MIVDILLGMRYDLELTKLMMEKVMNLIDLRESHAYQIIREEGGIDIARKILLALGSEKLGKPGVKIRRQIMAISDEAKLAKLCQQVSKVEDWKQLLADD